MKKKRRKKKISRPNVDHYKFSHVSVTGRGGGSNRNKPKEPEKLREPEPSTTENFLNDARAKRNGFRTNTQQTFQNWNILE